MDTQAVLKCVYLTELFWIHLIDLLTLVSSKYGVIINLLTNFALSKVTDYLTELFRIPLIDLLTLVSKYGVIINLFTNFALSKSC